MCICLTTWELTGRNAWNLNEKIRVVSYNNQVLPIRVPHAPVTCGTQIVVLSSVLCIGQQWNPSRLLQPSMWWTPPFFPVSQWSCFLSSSHCHLFRPPNSVAESLYPHNVCLQGHRCKTTFESSLPCWTSCTRTYSLMQPCLTKRLISRWEACDPCKLAWRFMHVV